MSGHPFLQPLDPSRGELLSDADPRETGVVELGDDSMVHVPATGSLADVLMSHVPLTTAKTSSSLATRDQQAYGSFGAAQEGPKELTRVRKTTR